MKQNAKIEKSNRRVCFFTRSTLATVTIAFPVLLSMSGCSDTESTQPIAVKKTGPDADGARAHVQQYVDQLLGGNLSVQIGLLGQDGIAFDVETLGIVSSLPKYLPDGRLISNFFTVVLNAKGRDRINGSVVVKRIECTVEFIDGKWSILGTEL